MRELKFRAVYDGKVYPWGTFRMKSTPESWQIYIDGIGRKTSLVQLEQYTGLQDKHDKPIYEGDILRFIEAHEYGCECEHCWPGAQVGTTCRVKWLDDGYYLLPLESDAYYEENSFCMECAAFGRLMSPNHEIPIGCYAEVIGNVHEHPELLEE
jgi:uncharacterized phage protein (TIGR01671 family)